MTTLDTERLLRETTWMRALGRELAGDRGEDVAQEAVRIALARPLAGRRLGAWLSGVVRHVARRLQRAEAGRVRRERAAARPEALPATDELVAEGELQRELVAAVMRLEEPYRSTVLLHYFRGHALVEIAREQGVPAATVRTRLRRALGRLREDLDGRCGGREAWVVVALGFQPGWTLGGGALVGTKGLVAFVGAASVLALLVWRAGQQNHETELAAASSALVGVEPGPAGIEGDPPGRGLEAVGDAPTRRELSSVAALTEVLLHGTAHDRDGQEVGAWISLEDEWAEVVNPEQTEVGLWSVAGLHPGRWTLRAGGPGLVSVKRELVLDNPVETLALVFDAAPPIRVRVLDEQGRAVEPGSLPLTLLVSKGAPVSGRLGLRMNPNELFGAGSLATWSPVAADSEVPPGFFGLVRPSVAPPFHVSLASRQDVLATRRVDERVEELVFTVAKEQLDARKGGVSVRHVDGLTGEPLPGVRTFLTLLEVSVRGGKGVESDAGGRARIEGVQCGVWRLHAVSEGHVYSTRAVRVEAGEVTDVGDVRLWPAATIRGRAFDEEGNPRSISFRWVPEGASPLDLENTNYSYGATFAITRFPAIRLWLVVRSEGHARMSVFVDASTGRVDDLELQLVRGERVVLQHSTEDIGRQVSIVTAAGGPIGSWSLGTQTTALRLAPGAYELWSGAGERVEERTRFVVGDEPVRLEVPPLRK